MNRQVTISLLVTGTGSGPAKSVLFEFRRLLRTRKPYGLLAGLGTGPGSSREPIFDNVNLDPEETCVILKGVGRADADAAHEIFIDMVRLTVLP